MSARDLFAREGIDRTTMADIAASVGVSTPTIFNYFGNKDGILVALISEGTAAVRGRDLASGLLIDGPFAQTISALFAEFSTATLEIASKRIWRYAEAAAIRHPRTALAREYHLVDAALVQVVADFMARFDMRLRSGGVADADLLARIFYDVWNTSFFDLITHDERSLSEHHDEIKSRMEPLAQMIFDDRFLAAPTLNKETKANGPS